MGVFDELSQKQQAAYKRMLEQLCSYGPYRYFPGYFNQGVRVPGVPHQADRPRKHVESRVIENITGEKEK